MAVTLVRVEKEQEEVLHNLMQFYVYDFTAFKPGIKLEDNGAYSRFDLKKYWEGTGGHPYFIKLGDELTGFALVSTGNSNQSNSIDEFHIIKKYTGRGFGTEAALQIFSKHPGNWKITQIQANEPAKAFWRKVISDYTSGNYTETEDSKRRTIQEFTGIH